MKYVRLKYKLKSKNNAEMFNLTGRKTVKNTIMLLKFECFIKKHVKKKSKNYIKEH
jgi:hypothetical protein